MDCNKVLQMKRQLQIKYEKEETEENFIHYIMSELLSPIEDYYNVLTLVRKNLSRIQDRRVLFVASFICSEWCSGENPFLEVLNSDVSHAGNKTKAIIWYLNAYQELWKKDKSENEAYRHFCLQKSVLYSKSMHFANNRYELSFLEDGIKAQMLRKEAKANVCEILTENEVKLKPLEYWIDIQRWIDEFILGISIADIIYREKYGTDSLGQGTVPCPTKKTAIESQPLKENSK